MGVSQPQQTGFGAGRFLPSLKFSQAFLGVT
jgi:hypothetical protein